MAGGSPTHSHKKGPPQLLYDKDNSGVPTHSGIQSSLDCAGNGIMSSLVLFNSISRESLVNGVVEEDGMEFEGGGEFPKS